MRHSRPTQKCTYFPHSGPVGCLPVPNIFPLAKETFAKGKMFWNKKNNNNPMLDNKHMCLRSIVNVLPREKLAVAQ